MANFIRSLNFIRCSNSIVTLSDGSVLCCENTIEDIKNQMSIGDVVVLDLTKENKMITVEKTLIVGCVSSD